MADLSKELALLGHGVTVVTPCITKCVEKDTVENLEIVRFWCPRFRDGGHLKRALCEMVMPALAFFCLWRRGTSKLKFDAVIVYSPSIFWCFLIYLVKIRHKCFVYLILRDIFPDWLLDLGLLNRNFAFAFLSKIADFLYSQSDIIAVQSPSNSALISNKNAKFRSKIRVLFNWQTVASENANLHSAVEEFFSKKIIVYAGNLGVAQSPGVIVDIACHLSRNTDIHFLLLGRGSERLSLMQRAEDLDLSNITFLDEVSQESLNYLLQNCFLGLITLDTRHKGHNIPGKFLSYLANDLPVLAVTSEDNDLARLIKQHDVGIVSDYPDDPKLLANNIAELCNDEERHLRQKQGCASLMRSHFSTKTAAETIVAEITATHCLQN